MSETAPLEVWVSKALLLGEQIRPCPLLMHHSEADTSTQTAFWNPLRAVLPGLVKVHYFDRIQDAGPVVLVPHEAKEWVIQNRFQVLRTFIRKAIGSGRTVVTFAGGMEYKPLPGEVAFAASAYDYPTEKVIPVPNWLYDIGHLTRPIARPARPTLAFDGNTVYPSRLNSFTRRIPLSDRSVFRMATSLHLNRNVALRYRFVIARYFRQRVLKAVRNAAEVQTHLVERGNLFTFTQEARMQARSEYLKAMQENAYILCMRGDANGDFRTQEVLSAGRIPVIVDTNFKLPVLQGMRWDDFCVFVPLHKLDRLGEVVQHFHDGLTDDEFQAKCRQARAAFEQLLPHRYIYRVVGEIQQRLPAVVRQRDAARQVAVGA